MIPWELRRRFIQGYDSKGFAAEVLERREAPDELFDRTKAPDAHDVRARGVRGEEAGKALRRLEWDEGTGARRPGKSTRTLKLSVRDENGERSPKNMREHSILSSG